MKVFEDEPEHLEIGRWSTTSCSNLTDIGSRNRPIELRRCFLKQLLNAHPATLLDAGHNVLCVALVESLEDCFNHLSCFILCKVHGSSHCYSALRVRRHLYHQATQLKEGGDCACDEREQCRPIPSRAPLIPRKQNLLGHFRRSYKCSM